MAEGVAGRKGLIASTAVSIATLIPVALHQLGAVRHLPDPPFAVFDSDVITCSEMAHPSGVPDSLLGMASYGMTLALALAASESGNVSRWLALKVAFDGGLAATNAVRQVVRFRKICFWCMGTVAASMTSVWIGRRLLRNQL